MRPAGQHGRRHPGRPVTAGSHGSGKVEYLEGLRGVAAMQVVALHFVTGFWPYLAGFAAPPIKLLFDGHSAVYVFFLISGAVLTPSFAAPGGLAAKCAKRLLRLGLPVAAAAAIACVLTALWPAAHRQAAAITGSAWLAMDGSGAPTMGHLLREIGLDALLLGYRESTLFGPVAAHLPPMQDSLDAPFWSLHVELYGSLMVLCLVALGRVSAWGRRGAILAAALAFGTDPLFLFVLGHLSAGLLRGRRGRGVAWLGAGLALGLALCATKDFAVVEAVRRFLAAGEMSAAPDLYQFQSQLGAAALCGGVLLCPAVWRLLASKPLRRLGRLSFGIYLLHFPILFTLGCAGFVALHAILPPGVAMLLTLAGFVAVTLLASVLFERWIDRPAVALARRLSGGRGGVRPIAPHIETV
jgi:peptidoglycan/LPS O-acetylase OafA/YrhL